ncbi:MAG TPA: flagellar basal body protein, partial [Acidimicrobiales bacterium]|nr:flagellar basal body protein [Acidimicrobiales bacterium]
MDVGIVGALQFAIDGVTAQQDATANNLANSETPGFTASKVSFQSSLSAALNTPGTQTAEVTSARSAATPATNGNNVQLASELNDSEQETLQFSAISEAINDQFRLVSGVAGGT